MAKNFWEREDFDIIMFCAVYMGVYQVYYDSCDYGTEYQANVLFGAALVADPNNAPLLKAYVDTCGDMPISDREMASFAVTYGIYKGRNEKCGRAKV